MEEGAKAKDVRLTRGTLDLGDRSVDVWYKQYDYPPKSWRYALRQSKARREFLSYEAMRRLGVQCAAPVACGEERDALGRLRRAFIVTVAIPQAVPLAEFVRANCIGNGSRAVKETIIRELAQITRRAHEGGFVHSDLWVRHVLVNWEEPGRPAVWLIDSPRGSVWRMFRRFATVLDLASLNKGAAELCTRAERMRFLKEYLGNNANRQVKQLARRVMTYRLSGEKKGVKQYWQQYVRCAFAEVIGCAGIWMMS
jgi:tRNA A-37 threonylcarbamoyl transferase component Bud32